MIVCNMTDSEGAREIRHPSRKMVSFPRDLLQRFINGRSNFREKMESRKEEEEEEDIELSLGLSLNGRFGVNPERTKNLKRSSSISNLMMSSEEESRGRVCLDPGGGGYEALTRTCSLPTETEEDWRKRKELQSHRRMEAKRKRLEKMKNVRVVKERIDSEKIIEENGRGVGFVPIRNGELSTPIGAELQPPQGSIASQGSGSSGVSDFESQPTQVPGTNQSTNAGSPAQVRSLPPRLGQKPVSRPGPRIDKPVAPKEGNGPVKSMMIDMPCVSTRGDRTNGKRIKGFLYRYRKGEEVKIVCVCHGSFLSPAEFVKHAGGGDVAHPLRHIVVCTSPWPIL